MTTEQTELCSLKEIMNVGEKQFSRVQREREKAAMLVVDVQDISSSIIHILTIIDEGAQVPEQGGPEMPLTSPSLSLPTGAYSSLRSGTHQLNI